MQNPTASTAAMNALFVLVLGIDAWSTAIRPEPALALFVGDEALSLCNFLGLANSPRETC